MIYACNSALFGIIFLDGFSQSSGRSNGCGQSFRGVITSKEVGADQQPPILAGRYLSSLLFGYRLRPQSSFKLSGVHILVTFGSRMFKGTLIAAVAGCTFLIASCNHGAEKRAAANLPA